MIRSRSSEVVSVPETLKHLQEAFAGESQANRKYLAFAQRAENEGYKQVARLFRATAEAETVHAINHLGELGGIRSTNENLQDAIKGELHEFQSMYPQMIEDARKEHNNSALRSFTFANKVEEIHAGLYKMALESLGNNKPVEYYVCQVCGNTDEIAAPEICPICGAKKQMFKKID